MLARGNSPGAQQAPVTPTEPKQLRTDTFAEFEDTPQTQHELAALLDSVSRSQDLGGALLLQCPRADVSQVDLTGR